MGAKLGAFSDGQSSPGERMQPPWTLEAEEGWT